MPAPVPTMLRTNAVPVPTTAPKYQPIVPPMNAPSVLSIFITTKTLGNREGYASDSFQPLARQASLQTTTAPHFCWKYSAG